MTDTNDRLAEIRARLDAATPAPWTRFSRCVAAPDEDDWFLGHDVHGPPAAQRGQIERVADAELIAHAPADLAHLLSLVDQLQGQLDAARALHRPTTVHGFVVCERCLLSQSSLFGKTFEIWPCKDAVALGLSEGVPGGR